MDAADEEEPQTRAAFNLLRSSYNSDAALVRDLYKEPLLQQKIRLICYDLQDLHHEYSSGLKKCSQEDTMRACADRAAYSWFSTVQAMMHRLGGSGLVDELKLFPRVPRHSTARPRSPDDEAIQDDRALVRLHFALLVELSANRCWSQTFYGFCFPYLVATVYCEDEFARARGAALMTRVCKAILKLEEFVSDNPMHATACALLESIATHKWQVTREIFVMGANTNWTWDDDELRATAWAMFSGPMTTKSTLESAFNHLRDKGARHSRNQKMSLETRYSYLATQPYARGDTGGVAQVRPTADDFTTLAREAAARDAIYSLKPFKPTATKMPQTYPHPLDIARKWRPAGFHANRVAAAAVALATSTAARSFAGIAEAWTGWAQPSSLSICIGEVEDEGREKGGRRGVGRGGWGEISPGDRELYSTTGNPHRMHTEIGPATTGREGKEFRRSLKWCGNMLCIRFRPDCERTGKRGPVWVQSRAQPKRSLPRLNTNLDATHCTRKSKVHSKLLLCTFACGSV